VELVFRWIKIGLAIWRLVDQKGIGENKQVYEDAKMAVSFIFIHPRG